MSESTLATSATLRWRRVAEWRTLAWLMAVPVWRCGSVAPLVLTKEAGPAVFELSRAVSLVLQLACCCYLHSPLQILRNVYCLRETLSTASRKSADPSLATLVLAANGGAPWKLISHTWTITMQSLPETRGQSFEELYGPPENFLEIEVRNVSSRTLLCWAHLL